MVPDPRALPHTGEIRGATQENPIVNIIGNRFQMESPGYVVF